LQIRWKWFFFGVRNRREPWLARSQVAGDFAQRVILHQPIAYARTIASDFLRGEKTG
jgi:hypothetical protein